MPRRNAREHVDAGMRRFVASSELMDDALLELWSTRAHAVGQCAGVDGAGFDVECQRTGRRRPCDRRSGLFVIMPRAQNWVALPRSSSSDPGCREALLLLFGNIIDMCSSSRGRSVCVPVSTVSE